jgi:hypothetical protein
MSDDLATELLVRVLRDQKIDARHMSLEDFEDVPPPGAVDAVSLVYIVSAFPGEERTRGDGASVKVRERFPRACVVAVFLPGMLLQPEQAHAAAVLGDADKSAESLAHAVQICLDMQSKAAQA